MVEQRSPKPWVVGSSPTRPGETLKDSMIGKIKKFVTETVLELKKVSWSTRKELIDSTWVVLVSSFFLGIFIGAIDFALSKAVELIIR